MYDVRIINNKAILFEDDNQVENLEPYRKNGSIRYEFDDGSYVWINSFDNIGWYDSKGQYHRDGDMPAYIKTNGYMSYCKHGKFHRECGPAVIYSSGIENYCLMHKHYSKEDHANILNSNYGGIYHV